MIIMPVEATVKPFPAIAPCPGGVVPPWLDPNCKGHPRVPKNPPPDMPIIMRNRN